MNQNDAKKLVRNLLALEKRIATLAAKNPTSYTEIGKIGSLKATARIERATLEKLGIKA